MLNIASSYAELKDNKNAKKSLQTLVAKYPDSSAAQTAQRSPGVAEVTTAEMQYAGRGI